jgi:hypothetical protein
MSRNWSIARGVGATLGLCLAVSLAGTATLAAGGPAGNNGTVKVQDGALDPTPVVKNEPHVCTFHLSFFFADAGQVGDWTIDQQPPTGRAQSVLRGSYLTDATGHDRTVEYGLPAGHYKLYWDGRNDQNLKHKTFWVTCDNPTGPIVHQVPTTITTALDGVSASFAVDAGAWVFDTATLHGATAHAGGTVTYRIFEDGSCVTQLGVADVQPVTDGQVTPSQPVEFRSPGTFYWQAEYSGDADNGGSISVCREEELTVNQPA